MERLFSVADVEKQCVQVINHKQGLFKVKSQDPAARGCWYNVSFGDGVTMPNCECADWEKNRLPCKHFLVIFQHFPDWNFDKLPVHYKESPFLTLDREAVFLKVTVSCVGDDSSDDAMTAAEEYDTCTQNTTHIHVEPSEIPQRNKYSRGWSTKCKEGAKQLTSLLHIVDDMQSLKEIYDLIYQCIDILSQASQKEEGIAIHKPPEKSKPRTRVASSLASNRNGLTKIPKAKRRHPFSGRHGAKAETMKRTLNVDVDITQG